MFQWLKQRLQRSESTSVSSEKEGTEFPRLFTRDEGALKITVHEHEIKRRGDTLPCWTYITEGLRSAGQKELQFVLVQEPGETAGSFPREVLGFFSLVLRLAREGRLVDAGAYTQLGVTPLCDYHGILYVDASPM